MGLARRKRYSPHLCMLHMQSTYKAAISTHSTSDLVILGSTHCHPEMRVLCIQNRLACFVHGMLSSARSSKCRPAIIGHRHISYTHAGLSLVDFVEYSIRPHLLGHLRHWHHNSFRGKSQILRSDYSFLSTTRFHFAR